MIRALILWEKVMREEERTGKIKTRLWSKVFSLKRLWFWIIKQSCKNNIADGSNILLIILSQHFYFEAREMGHVLLGLFNIFTIPLYWYTLQANLKKQNWGFSKKGKTKTGPGKGTPSQDLQGGKRFQRLYQEVPRIISCGSKDYIMRFQRLYRVESDFSVSFGPKPKLNNNKKGRVGERG